MGVRPPGLGGGWTLRTETTLSAGDWVGLPGWAFAQVNLALSGGYPELVSVVLT